MSLTKGDDNDVQPNANRDEILALEPYGDEVHGRSIMEEIGISNSKNISCPKFRYTADQLYAFSDIPYARRRPSYLDPEHFNDSGAWDPESWASSVQERKALKSAQSLPQEERSTKRERPSDLDREGSGKRRSSGTGVALDPRERVKEEQDGIVLSPQRRSFGTGCHVTQQASVFGAAVTTHRRSESPVDIRDNHRESSRRINTGRLLSRERDRERDFSYRGSERSDRRERFEREERSGESGRFSRDRNSKEKDSDRRGNRDKGYHRRIEEEPEWLSGGPTSQSEFIELRGFDETPEEASVATSSKGDDQSGKRGDKRKSWRKQKSPSSTSEGSSSTVVEDDATNNPTSRPGSKSSNQSSSRGKGSKIAVDLGKDSTLTEKSSDAGTSEFDFNELFSFEAIPGFLSENGTPSVCDSGLVGSRFGQFFQVREMSPLQSRSQTPSIQDELHMPLISVGKVDPSVPSTYGSDSYFIPISPDQSTLTTFSDGSSKRLLDILLPNVEMTTNSSSSKPSFENYEMRGFQGNEKAVSVQELEASLKNLLNTDQPKTHCGVSEKHRTEPNAFKKLLSQISDGRVTPASSQNLSLGPIDKSKMLQEQDILEHEMQFDGEADVGSNNHLLKILKNAPTEQDILAALGHSSARVESTGETHKASFSPINSSSNPLSKIMINRGNFVSPVEAAVNFVGNMDQQAQAAANRHTGNLSTQLSEFGIQIRNQQPTVIASQVQPNSIQQQQRDILAAILKQQQQQQVRHGPQQQSPIASLLPIIQRPPSSPPARNYLASINGSLQPPLSPNPQTSPHHCADGRIQNLVQQQEQQQLQRPPQIPSPLVFGQTPPAINHAPSPIHPSQTSMTNSTTALPSNTLQVHTPQVMARVPSPQELRAHTQQIMQNALIKKKLEEQKEKYRKQQEMQGSRSSISTKFEASVNPAAFNVTSPGKSVGAFAQAFTPTAVMRKMQVGKEKDVFPSGKLDARLQSRPLHGETDGSIQMHFQRLGFLNGGQQPLQCGQNIGVHTPNLAGQLPTHGRRIVKSNCQQGTSRLNTQPPYAGNQPSIAFPQTASNYEVMNQLRLQQQVAAAVQCQPSNLTHLPSNLGPSGMPVRTLGRPVVSIANVNPAGLHLRNVVPPPVSNSLSHLSHLAARQQHVGGGDPRHFSSNHQLAMQQLLMSSGGASRSSIPTTMGGIQMPRSIAGRNDRTIFSGQMSSKAIGDFLQSGGLMQSSVGRQSPVSNLAKWFGSDVLKQTVSELPPVPMQKAQYVDEVEQGQQQAAAVHN